MQIKADLHLHSKYARATSKDMDIHSLSDYAKIKGLNLLGTGDFTHPKQLNDLKKKLEPIEDKGLYRYNDVFFMLTTEMATFYFQDKKSRRVHHLVHSPSFEIVDQIIDVLSKKGANTGIDGRMMMKISSPELVEILHQISKDIHIIPAHIWTPYFGCLGSVTGFDSIKDCYLDQTKNIFAIETGLSSDPLMNWRVSELDNFVLMSNSDSHSPWPWRLGREANVFELDEMNYFELWDAIKNKDRSKLLYTIEVDPNYGKYHYTGHRNCNVVMHPKEARKQNNICPVCKKQMTIGVLQRVEELADREEGFIPKNAVPFKSLLPLYEIISFVKGSKQLYSKKIVEEQNKIINNFGSELEVLINASFDDLIKVTDEKITKAIIDIREQRILFKPGYDGTYGEPIFNGERKLNFNKSPQKSLSDF
ncbi:MAG: endonuclease Q family protein [Candidatus Aenigmatarchaeota archaeon]|nr:endonuclease Q family protein [Candidatus Aenigmarchaeota archaeon]